MTHGTLTNTNSGVEIPAKLSDSANGSAIRAYIDGAATANVFYKHEGWTFTPEKKFPTEVGSVIQVTKWYGKESGPNWRAMLTASGWRFAIDKNTVYSTQELKRDMEIGEFDFEVLL